MCFSAANAGFAAGYRAGRHSQLARDRNLYNRPANRGRNAAVGAGAGVGAAAALGDRSNNVFADRDGNVFRRNEDGSWQQRQDGYQIKLRDFNIEAEVVAVRLENIKLRNIIQAF